MIRQCASCKVLMGEKAPFTDKSITHGICRGCMRKQLEKVGIVVTEDMLREK